jgi:hypothetical protein
MNDLQAQDREAQVCVDGGRRGHKVTALPEAVVVAGTYRIIYRIDDEGRIVTVVDVDHRRDVYRT